MFGFGNNKQEFECALIVDIGSGSVGLALLLSDKTQTEPEIIWTHRENTLMKDFDSFEASQKIIKTAIINAFLELGNNGLKTLSIIDSGLKVRTMQVAISAPWSYTVTKTIRYTDDKTFTVDDELIEELATSARKDALETMEATDLKKQGLVMITDATVNVNLNGYKIDTQLNQSGQTLELSQVLAVSHKTILEVINDSREKIIPKAKQKVNSFMFTFYRVLSEMNPDTSEIALIDVTNEATEIGVVREGVLQFVTYTPNGSFSLAREIASAVKIPNEEAYVYLKGDMETLQSKLTETQKEKVETVINNYCLELSSALKETGDKLSVPKTIFLHCHKNTELFFKSEILKAAKIATNSTHSVHTITSKLLGNNEVNDTAILLSAHYFHTQSN